MTKRYIYSLKMGWKHRKNLNQIVADTPKTLETTLICPKELFKSGIKVLILDFDGVLASDGQHEPHFEIKDWLDQCVDIFKDNIFILSNKPKIERKRYFAEFYPNIQFVHSKRKKPYPDGIEQILKNTKVNPEEALIVDDRLLTGILAGMITGIKAKFIRSPYQNFKQKPLSELFFASLRVFECQLLKFSQMVRV